MTTSARRRSLLPGAVAVASISLVLSAFAVPSSAGGSPEASGATSNPDGVQQRTTAGRPQTPAAPRKKKRLTTFVLTIHGCEGCSIGIGADYRNHRHHLQRTRVVRNGKIRFTMPRSKTRGLVMSVDHPTFPGHAEVVMRYADLRVGQLVPDPHYTDRAHACWYPPKKRRIEKKLFTAIMYTDYWGNDDDKVAGLIMYRGVRTIGKPSTTFESKLLMYSELEGICG